MGSFNSTYSIPEFEEVVSEVSYEFLWEGYPVSVEAKTGMVEINAGWTEQPERVVAFSGTMYETNAMDDVISEYEMFHLDVTLRPIPRWMDVLARLGNEEEPDSVEEFFYEFVYLLGYNAGFIIPPQDVRDEFEVIADRLRSQDGFAESVEERDVSWKPDCVVYSPTVIHW